MLVRPSYVLGGRGMEIVYDEEQLEGYIDRATQVSPEHPVLVDRFLDDAIEIDVDALFDGHEHVPRRGHGAHRGGRHPLRRLGLRAAADHPGPRGHRAGPRSRTEAIARGVGVLGLLNVQFALAPTSSTCSRPTRGPSRTAPFVSKATGVPLAKAAARIMLGATIAELRAEGLLPAHGDGGTLPADAPVAVKEAVLPFRGSGPRTASRSTPCSAPRCVPPVR